MTDRWQQVGELFDRIVTAPPETRTRLLEAADIPDDIREEVRSLLEAHDAAEGFMDEDAAGALQHDSSELEPGTTLGAYRILGVLGRGGMGIVYDAEDTRLHRRVALKSLPPEVSGDEQQRARLRHEARAAAALQHPGVATVYALEEFDGHLFISSEYLPGHTLREEIGRQAPDPERALRDGIELAQALCAAHERGVVHRDLKPENIVRTLDGKLKILDFGLARLERPANDSASYSRLTLAGALVGTPAYMAPEQLLGRRTDFRVDHFALGVLLYELATGAHPFAASSLPTTLARILADAPDPPKVAIPEPFWMVITRCMEKEPEHRFASTRELVAALEAALPGLKPGPTPPVASPGLKPGPAPVAPSAPIAPSAPMAPIAPGAPITPTAPEGWWRFHQFAVAVVYFAMLWPVWHIHRTFGRMGLFVFFATLAAVVVAAVLRLHLWFSSRVYPEDLREQRANVSGWIRAADIAFATLLVVGGIALPDTHAGWAALMISVGVGAALAFLFIEPATARAAFRNSRAATHSLQDHG